MANRQSFVLALDQGTTSSRAIVFDREGRIVASSQQEFEQLLPQPGHVEHDPEAIWSSQLGVARRVLQQAGLEPAQIAAVGVTNQRETTLLWERQSGRPVANAIVWQSRVTTPECERLKSEGLEDLIRDKTGLLIDPYFAGTKLKYLLDRHDRLRERAQRGDILFGTVDSFLIWRLSGGKRHVTDFSNASRTLLFNIHTLEWDDELLRMLNVPRAMLPEVVPSSAVYGSTDAELFGGCLPIAGAAGDQQAATFGQACFEPGRAKNTYGTGCFLLVNVGAQPVRSQHRLLTTVGWVREGQVTYCLEGSVFVGGAVVQWLRDGLQMLPTSADVEQLAGSVPDTEGVYLVPAFVGLGAPHWDPYARGALFGLTRGSTAGHVARAAVESIAYQSHDLLEAMRQDAGTPIEELKVDGGASLNNALLQFQADITDVTVRRPVVAETTALGAAYLAGLAVGYWSDLSEIERNWQLDREFVSQMSADERQRRLRGWRRAVQRSRDWEEH